MRAVETRDHRDASTSNIVSAFQRPFVQASNWQIACLIFSFSILFLLISMARFANVYDESLVLVGATRVLEGAVPHRDFYVPLWAGEFLCSRRSFQTIWRLGPGRKDLGQRHSRRNCYGRFPRGSQRRGSARIPVGVRSRSCMAPGVWNLRLSDISFAPVRASRSSMFFACLCRSKVAVVVVRQRGLCRGHGALPL